MSDLIKSTKLGKGNHLQLIATKDTGQLYLQVETEEHVACYPLTDECVSAILIFVAHYLSWTSGGRDG